MATGKGTSVLNPADILKTKLFRIAHFYIRGLIEYVSVFDIQRDVHRDIFL